MKAIMYHYVRRPSAEMPCLRFLNVDHFKKQLDYFEDEFGFVAQEDFMKALESKADTKARGVLLTFDDGFRDHIEFVLPELKRRGLWGFFFISTGHYQSKKLLAVHRIHYLLSRVDASELVLKIEARLTPEMRVQSELQKFRGVTYLMQTNPDHVALIKRLLNYYLTSEQRDEILDGLFEEFAVDEENLHSKYYLNPDEIRKLETEGMIVGSHTATHRLLSSLSLSEQEAEIKASIDFLEQATGGLRMRSFCYPYGGFHSFSDETEKLLIAQGVKLAFNVEPRDIEFSDICDRPTALPRFNCNQFQYGTAS